MNEGIIFAIGFAVGMLVAGYLNLRDERKGKIQ